MTQHIVFLLLGLGSGAVFAALALGLVMTYRSSGVVNFATGTIALYAAYTYSFLRRGELLLPLPGLPVSVGVGGPLGFVPAFAGALALSAGLGALLHLVIFRALRTAPAVAKAVASLGVMVVLQALFALRLGTDPVRVEPIFPRRTYTLGGLRVPSDRVWFALVVLAVAAALALVLRLTRFGLATRAAAETEKGALVSGLSPDRIALANWALSAAVAGVGGILIAPIVPLTPSAYTLFLVPALAAALAADFRGLWLAVLAALLIGMIQSELTYLQTQHSWLPQHGLAELVPLAAVLGFLVFHGRTLPQRGALIVRTLGGAPRPRGLLAPAALWTAVGVAALLATGGSYRAALITSLILSVIALSLVVVTGFAGQVSLAQLSLAGAGAFLLSRLTGDLSVPFPIAPLLAAAGATVVGVVIGLPALRIRGLPVAVVTLALAVALEALWFRNPDFTGGVQGASVTQPRLFGLDLGVGGGSSYPRVAFGVTCLVILALVAVGVARLRTSALGAAMLAVRTNERSAAAAGIDVTRTKLLAFAIASFIAGLGGSLLAYQQSLATPDTYAALAGFSLFAVAYVAGITSVTGGLLAGLLASGGVVYVVVARVAPSLGSWYEVLTGCALVVQVIRNPEGLAAGPHRLARYWHGWRARTAAKAVLAVPGGVPARAEPLPEPPAPKAPVTMDPAEVALSLDALSVLYGGVTAVDRVSLDVHRGGIVGLIGPNGAGKTTLIDAVSGFAPAAGGGSVEFGGRRIDGLRPHQRVRLGLGRTFQGLELWEDLSGRENIMVGLHAARGRHPDIGELSALLSLDDVLDRPVRELSQGQRQLVSVARSLAGGPEVLLLDEPASGLDSTESRWLAERLRRVRDSGVTIVMVDHDMNLMLSVCDRIHVLDLGRLIASGTPDEIRQDPRVADAYLGTAHADTEVTG